MELEEKYTLSERKLLAVIGEAYIGMNYGYEGDYGYYRNRLNNAVNELEELQENLAKRKRITVYRAYKNPESNNFKYKDFNNKSEALAFVKNNNWDAVTKFVYVDKESYDIDTNILEETDVYISPNFKYRN